MGDFYDQLSPFYHLLFDDWEESMSWQAERLAGIIEERWGGRTRLILDVSCGIGTQTMGLARLGYQLTASDISPEAVARAKGEARDRGLSIHFRVCDMREAYRCHGGGFDLVISADNSVPHLLSDDDILSALQEMYACLRPGGGCLLTVRDYDQEERGRGIVKPYSVRDRDGQRTLIFQVWDFEGQQYVLSMYIIVDDKQTLAAKTHVFRTRYYAIGTDRLLRLMGNAGFEELDRLDDVFYQPVLVGTKQA